MSKILTAVGRQLVHDIFAKQAFATQIGATIERIEHGLVEIKYPRHPLVLQHHDTFHGGMLSYFGDTTGGLACISLLTDPTHSLTTVELKINFLKPAIGSYIIGRGKVLSEGGSLIVASTELFSDNNTLVAYMVQTNKKLKPRLKNHDK
jgi:uncharacterized protein (TIGR00369 family)